MAAGGPIQELCEELTCSICLDYFRDPVTTAECGHNFCRDCLSRSWGKLRAEASCPQCRRRVQQRNLKPNRQLANVVEIAKKLSFQGGRKGEAKGRVCEKHQEPLKLFCRVDRVLICVVCDRSKEHRHHDVVPVEEAAQQYKYKLHSYTEILKKERGKILACKEDVKKQTQSLLERTELARRMSVAEFRKWHQFLEKQEQLLLAEVQDVEKEIARERDKQLARLSGKLCSLECLIQELERKVHQTASEFLQDVESFLKRCKKKEETGNSIPLNPELTWRTDNFGVIKCFLQADLQKFKDTFESQLHPQKVNVSLDPDTAHPKLIISEDRKCVRFEDNTQHLPNNPERFDGIPIVLGREGFTSGRHFWEVTVECEGRWAVGVARKSVKRKGAIIINSEEGIWAMGKLIDRYRALSHPYYTPLSRSDILERIRVSLNYTEGQVDFFNADTGALLYRFSVASFNGEILFPYFQVFENSYLRLS